MEFFPPGTNNLEHFAGRLHIVILQLSGDQRMLDLQSELLDFGERGGAAIAVFIESCRNFDDYREQFLQSLARPVGEAPVDTRQFHLQQLQNKARVIDAEAKAALVALGELGGARRRSIVGEHTTTQLLRLQTVSIKGH